MTVEELLEACGIERGPSYGMDVFCAEHLLRQTRCGGRKCFEGLPQGNDFPGWR